MDELKKSSNEMNKMSEYTARVNEKADYALRNTQSALEKSRSFCSRYQWHP